MPKNKTTDRANIQFDLGDPNIQSQITPRDTFVAPGLMTFGKPVNAGKNLMELGQALQGGLKAYQKYDARETDQMKKESFEQARADYMTNKVSFKKAQQQGLIAQGANPHYQKYYKMLELQSLGRDWGASFEKYAIDNKLHESEDEKNFKEEKDKHLGQWMESHGVNTHNDLDVSQAFIPTIQKEELRLFNKHQSETIKHQAWKGEVAFQKDVTTSIEQIIGGDYESLGLDSSANQKQVNAGLSKLLQDKLNDKEMGAIANGLPGAKANEYMARILINTAKDEGDKNLLRVLENIKGNQGAYIAKTTKISEMITAARVSIDNRDMTEMKNRHYIEQYPVREHMLRLNYDHAKNMELFDETRKAVDIEKLATLERNEKVRGYFSAFTYLLFKNPELRSSTAKGGWNNPDVIKQMEEVDGKLRGQILNQVKTLTETSRYMDNLNDYVAPNEKRKTYLGLIKNFQDDPDGWHMGAIETAYIKNQITKPEFEVLIGKQKDARLYNHPVFKTGMWTEIESMIDKAFSNKDSSGDLIATGIGAINSADMKINAKQVAWEMLKGMAGDKGMDSVPADKLIDNMRNWTKNQFLHSGREGLLPGESEDKNELIKKSITTDNSKDMFNGFSPEVHSQVNTLVSDTTTLITDLKESPLAKFIKPETTGQIGGEQFEQLQELADNSIVPGDEKQTRANIKYVKEELARTERQLHQEKLLDKQNKEKDELRKQIELKEKKQKTAIKSQTRNNEKKKDEKFDADKWWDDLSIKHEKEQWLNEGLAEANLEDVIKIFDKPEDQKTYKGLTKKERAELFKEAAVRLKIPDKAWLIENIFNRKFGKK